MKKANLRLMGLLCPRIKHRIKNTVVFYQWFLIPIIVLFVSCQALAQEVKVQQMPSAATVDTIQVKSTKNKDSRHEYVTDERVINRTKKLSPDADLERFPLIKYNPDYSGIEGLTIGDSIPNALWDMPLWVTNHPEGKDTIRLREYQNEKLLILDFWARFCSSCLESMDKWDSYVKETNSDVKLIGVLLDYDYRALMTSQARGWKAPTVLGSEAYLVNRYFFTRDVISRMAWIKDGKLLAITSVRGYDFDTVQKVLNDEPVTIPVDSNWTYFNTNNLNQ